MPKRRWITAGRLSLRRRQSAKRRRLGVRLLLWSLRVGAGLVLFSLAVVLILRWVDPPFSAIMAQRAVGAWWRGDPHYHLRQQWLDWRRISPQAPLAMLAAEDQRFAEHHGFDFVSIKDAVVDHIDGQKLRGASTISQQVAKNLFLWSSPSFIRKGFEVYFTLLIELCWSKQRILEVYVNVAELGRGIFGVAAASTIYFHKSAAALTADEAALLAASLPNPIRIKIDPPSDYALRRQGQIMQQMELLGLAYLNRL